MRGMRVCSIPVTVDSKESDAAAHGDGNGVSVAAFNDLEERMIGLTPDKAVGQPAAASSPVPDDRAVLPDKSAEDTDAAWGEPPRPDDDERLYGERPPHWDSV
jgi:hypothetical protein